MTKKLYCKEVLGKGLGVFCTEDIEKGEIIEIAPTIIIPIDQIAHIDKTQLYNYYFAWHDDAALPLGYGAVFNHSYHPNAAYAKDYTNKLIEFYAIRYIPAGVEICTNYNGDPECQDKLWFDVK